MSGIHPTALVSPSAKLGRNLTVGPYSVIESDVVIGDNCSIGSHVVIKRDTTMGENNQVHDGAILGGCPQHLGLGDEMGGLIIGSNNAFRENCTVHRAYVPHENTTLGDHNMVMVNAHIAHDCHINNNVIIANNVMLAGHVDIDDRAYISGAVGIHQFCRVGRLAMVGGQARVTRDIPPFTTVDGDTSAIVGLNLIGLRRSGMASADIRQLKAAYRIIFRQQLHWDDIIESLQREFTEGPAAELAPFLVNAKRGIARSRTHDAESAESLDRPKQRSSILPFSKDEAA